MRILFVSSEVYPFSKTGGLADVAAALPEALVKLGHEVLVISPWYQSLKAEPAPLWIGDIDIPFDGSFSRVGVGELQRQGVRYAFVGHEDFQRDKLYGYEDDIYRFCRFCRAVPQVSERAHFLPDVVHVNDWHSGFLPMLLQHGWHLPQHFVGRASVFTVHNVQYQGVGHLDSVLYWLRLPSALRDSYLNHFNSANAMQAAVGFADRVTTVSPSYATELYQTEYGYGLDGTFRHIAGKFSGILNGLDYAVWNPESDELIHKTYGVTSLEDKQVNKLAFCQRFGLDAQRPLAVVVSRLAGQKGIDIVVDAHQQLLEQGWSLFFLASGDAQLEQTIHQISQHPHIASYVGYDEALAHQCYAASDSILIPSRFEPCGLSQMIAMRYGSIPIARKTGGLGDSIRHSDTGFLFESASSEGLLWASWVAYECYFNRNSDGHWHQMVQNAMREDFSWEASAQRYLELYQEIS